MSQISNKRENKHVCNQLAENKYLVEKTKCYQQGPYITVIMTVI